MALQLTTVTTPMLAVAPVQPLVKVDDLTVKFVSREATVQAVNGVSFEMAPGEVLCIIGESGSGKSVTMRALIRLLPKRRTVISGGMRVGDNDILALSESYALLDRQYPGSRFVLTVRDVDAWIDSRRRPL